MAKRTSQKAGPAADDRESVTIQLPKKIYNTLWQLARDRAEEAGGSLGGVRGMVEEAVIRLFAQAQQAARV